MKNLIFLSSLIALVFIASSVSALTILDISTSSFSPGQESQILLTLKNNLNSDVRDVSISLDLSALPFTARGGTEDSIDKIDENDRENLVFTLRADNNAKAGNYKVPYTISYFTRNGNISTKKGTFGITVVASPILSFSTTSDKPVLNDRSKVTFKIINKGLGEARFVDVTIIPDGYTLLSDSKNYIGSISSDDFETITLDVSFTNTAPLIRGNIEYIDPQNVRSTIPFTTSLTVYTREEALKKGIISRSNVPLIITLLVVLIIIWIVWRARARRKRMRKSLSTREN